MLTPPSVLSGSVSPNPVEGIGSGTVETVPATVTITGGVAPYSGVWTRTSGSTQIDPVDAIAATTTFVSSGVTGSTFRSATFVYVITDAIGTTANSESLAVVIQGNV